MVLWVTDEMQFNNMCKVLWVKISPEAINVKFGTGAKFYVYQGNVSPLQGEKPIFGPLSKNNTGMAALCAGLPVIKLFCKCKLGKNAKLHLQTKELQLSSCCKMLLLLVKQQSTV